MTKKTNHVHKVYIIMVSASPSIHSLKRSTVKPSSSCLANLPAKLYVDDQANA